MSIDVASFLFIGALSTVFAGVIFRVLRLNWRGAPRWLMLALALLLVWLLLSGSTHSDALQQLFSRGGR
ncbi:MAG: hypothetical protein H7Y32_09540 [Chloroflexales bacterium]|nr:hypothetical protein [Chloroflexales bacterium]